MTTVTLNSLFAASQFLQTLRPTLTANTTYFVRSDGNDNNNGLTNTSTGAFRQINRAIEVAQLVDLNGYNLTIQVGNGTYNAVALTRNLVGGTCSIVGNTTTPSNCIIEENNSVGYALFLNNCSTYTINGFELRANLSITPESSAVTGFSRSCFIALNSYTKIDNIVYRSTDGNSGYHMFCQNSTIASNIGTHSFFGNAYCLMNILQSNLNWYDAASVNFPNNTLTQITFNGNSWSFNLGPILLLMSNIDFFNRRFSGSWSGGNFGRIEGGLIRLRHPQLPSNVQSMTLGAGGFSIIQVS
jgi:hypothetical protein